jgi:3-oxoadipate enol-lactonase
MPSVKVDSCGGIDIYYEDRGKGDPLVLVGGITSTADVWGLMVPTLAERHRVVTADNRGSGRTRVADDDGVRTPERFAADVLALIDALELDTIHLAGASMGGMIVQEFALRHPDRLRSLTIMCSTFGGPNGVQATPEVMTAMFKGSQAGASEADRLAALATQMHPDTPQKRGDRLAFYESTKRAHPHTAEELARRAKGLGSFDVYQRLEELKLPTLVMAGTHDILIPSENARLLAQRISGARLELIEDSGHIFFVEQPDATSAALLDFIENLAAAPR